MGDVVIKNYKLRTNLFLLLFIVAIINIVTFFYEETTVFANANPITAKDEKIAGLKSAPDNLGLDSDMFTVPTLSGYSNVTNGKNIAELEDDNGIGTIYSKSEMKAIRMTQYTSQIGVIWSKLDYGISIDKKQTLSMWLYFGPTTHADKTDFGDGMAFVIHNSVMGTNAVSHKGDSIGSGQALGVWGVDNDKNVSDPQLIANTAIDNSWALEFDTHVNNDKSPGGAAGFDQDISGQHIAYGYPAKSSTYKDHYYYGGILGTSGNYFTMNHTNPKVTALHDGKWHHLTMTWEPVNSTMTYAFNDKDPDTKEKLTSGVITGSEAHIKASDFGGKDALKAQENKLYWGFTASTGTLYEPNLIAFESIPAQAEGDVTPTLKDVTQNKDVKDNEAVNSGDKLNFIYDLKYDSGRDRWSNIKTKIPLIDNVTILNGDAPIGDVTYDDGTTESILPSDIKTESVTKNGVEQKENFIEHGLSKSLFSDNPTDAKVTIYGTANKVDAPTKVAAKHAIFDSDTLIKDAYSIPFVINKAKPLNLTLDKNKISVAPNKDAKVTGSVSYTDGTAITNTDVTVHATLNGTALDDFTMSDSDAAGKLNFTIPANKLTGDSNTLDVYVQDSNGNRSSTSSVIISKQGNLSLKVENYSFGSINQTPNSMLIPRKGLWNIVVNDSREDGVKTPWTLSAQTDGLYNGATKFNGNVIYKNSNGNETAISGKSYISIATGHKTQDGEQDTNIGQLWNESDGLMLRTNGITESGNYSGQMNWILSDTV